MNAILTASSTDAPLKTYTVTRDQPTVKISCPNMHDARYCRMFNEEGKELIDTCETYGTAYGQITTWECRTMRWGQMTETKSRIDLIMEGKMLIISRFYYFSHLNFPKKYFYREPRQKEIKHY